MFGILSNFEIMFTKPRNVPLRNCIYLFWLCGVCVAAQALLWLWRGGGRGRAGAGAGPGAVLFPALPRLLTALTSPVAEHGLQGTRVE